MIIHNKFGGSFEPSKEKCIKIKGTYKKKKGGDATCFRKVSELGVESTTHYNDQGDAQAVKKF